MQGRVATGSGPFGLGVAIGDPIGVAVKYRLTGGHALSAAVGWSRYGAHLIGDYHWFEFVYLTKRVFTLASQFGTGLRLVNGLRYRDLGTALGVRLPGSIAIRFHEVPVELSLEPAVVLNLVPYPGVDLDVTLYARYFF
jgi:hypothetical protein